MYWVTNELFRGPVTDMRLWVIKIKKGLQSNYSQPDSPNKLGPLP